MTREKYSEEFKDAIVTKMFNRGSQTITEVCRQEGVSKSAVRACGKITCTTFISYFSDFSVESYSSNPDWENQDDTQCSGFPSLHPLLSPWSDISPCPISL